MRSKALYSARVIYFFIFIFTPELMDRGWPDRCPPFWSRVNSRKIHENCRTPPLFFIGWQKVSNVDTTTVRSAAISNWKKLIKDRWWAHHMVPTE